MLSDVVQGKLTFSKPRLDKQWSAHTASVSLTLPVLLQVGHRHVVDATLQEKACSVASLIMSVTHKGTVTCTRKVGGGSLDPESIFEMTEVSLVLLRRHLASSGLIHFSLMLPFNTTHEILHCVKSMPSHCWVMDRENNYLACLEPANTKYSCCFQAGKRVGKALHAPLMKLLHQEESLGKNRQKVGFLS